MIDAIEVVCGRAAAPVPSSKCRPGDRNHGPFGLLRTLISRTGRGLRRRAVPVTAPPALRGNHIIDVTPAHTAGSQCVLLPDGTVLAGDALTEGILPPHSAEGPLFAENPTPAGAASSLSPAQPRGR